MAEPFRAFLSYSRSASPSLAVDLQNGLERFAKPWYRLRALRVFRDDSSMAANTALWSTIETGLREAEWFILLATPAAAASAYVQAELDWWLRHKGPQRLLIVQAEGDLHWDRSRGCFHPASTAVPAILHHAYPEEPRWIDLRWYAATDPATARADPRFDERIADLAAAIRGVERDTLVGDNVRQHRRALGLARGAVIVLAVLLVLSIVAGVAAVGQRNAAREQARIAQARQLAATARTLASTDIGTARLLAVQAYRLAPEQSSANAVFASLVASPQLVREFDAGGRIWNTAGSADGETVVAATDDGTVTSWDVASGERTVIGNLGGQPFSLTASRDAAVIAGRAGDVVSVWIAGRPVVLPADLPGGPTQVAVSPSGDTLVVAYGGDRDAYVLRRAGDGFVRADTGLRFGAATIRLTLPDDADVVAELQPAGEAVAERRSLRTGGLLSRGRGGGGSFRLQTALSADGRYLATPVNSNTGAMPIFATDRVGTGSSPTPARIGYAGELGDPQPALSPDGSVSAYAIDDVISVALTQRPGPEPFAVTQLRGLTTTETNSLTFLSNRHLLSGSGHRLLVWDLTQDTALGRTVSADIPFLATVDISRAIVPNRSAGAVVAIDSFGGFTVADTATGAVRTGGPTSRFLAWRDDSSFFYADRSDRSLVRYDLAAGRDVDRRPFDWPDVTGSNRYDLWSAAYVAERDQLLVSGRRLVGVVDAVTGRVLSRRTDLSYPTFSADGRHVFGIPDVAAPRGAVADPAGGPVTELDAGALRLDPGSVEAAGFQLSGYHGDVLVTQADGAVQRIFWSADGTARLGEAPAAEGFTDVRIAVDPDGRWYAQHRSDDTLELAAVRGGAALGLFPLRRDDPKISFAFSGDGRRLVVVFPADVDPAHPEGRVTTVDLTVDGWIATACRTAGRNLSDLEWRDLTGTEPPGDLRCR